LYISGEGVAKASAQSSAPQLQQQQQQQQKQNSSIDPRELKRSAGEAGWSGLLAAIFWLLEWLLIREAQQA
jgi:hypothetical protein